MTRFLPALGLAALMSSAAAADPVGLRLSSEPMAHQDTPVRTAIWYPAQGGTPERFAENPVFVGVDVVMQAAPAPGRHPVIALSHGLGGGIESIAWLAAALAERGAVVVSVSHPNTTFSDFDLTDGARHWTRAQDLSAALDLVQADPALGPLLDTGRVMAAGFSYGGWTALSLGGARSNHAGFVQTCTDLVDRLVHCDAFLAPEVGLADIDPADWNGDHSDARVTHVVAIDPGFVWGLEAADLDAVIPQVRMIGLGAGADRMPATDFDASGLTALLPQARVDRIAPGHHFTAMPLCQPAGAAILEDEQDDPVCTDPAGADRAAIHARIVSALAADLGLEH